MYTWYLLGLVLWVILAFWPAYVAKRKGHSFILFFLLSLIFFFLSLVLAYLVNDRYETPEDREADEAAEKALAKEENQS